MFPLPQGMCCHTCDLVKQSGKYLTLSAICPSQSWVYNSYFFLHLRRGFINYYISESIWYWIPHPVFHWVHTSLIIPYMWFLISETIFFTSENGFHTLLYSWNKMVLKLAIHTVFSLSRVYNTSLRVLHLCFHTKVREIRFNDAFCSFLSQIGVYNTSLILQRMCFHAFWRSEKDGEWIRAFCTFTEFVI